MSSPTSHPIRAHLAALVVVAGVLAVAGLSLVRPDQALGAPVDPVPVGVWPLPPVPTVVRGFDPPDGPYAAGHRGVDLLGTVGEPVRSALPGRVRFTGVIAGRGVVVVDHGATRTTYEPVVASVRPGDVVARGGPIGRLELAGSHCSPSACLHWGWLRGDTYLDPLLLVGGGQVRLLPLWRDQPLVSSPVWHPPRPPYAGLVTARRGAPAWWSQPVRDRAPPRSFAMRIVLVV